MNSMNQHIAIYLPSLHGGGAERIMVTLANAFAERGFKTDLVLAKAAGPYLKDISKKVQIVDLNAERVATSLPKLVRYLRTERPDAMLSALNYANVIALFAKRLSGVRTRLVVSERAALSSSLSHAKLRRSRWIAHLMSWTYPWADGVIAISDGVADDLAVTIGLTRNRINTVYNPVDLVAVRQRAEEDINHPWFAPGEPPIILGMGRLTAQKDFPTLIRSFAQIQEIRPARLVILGEGDLRPQLQKLITELGLSEVVAMPGFCGNPFTWMRQSAVFVFSSAWEGFGNVLVEAMACGTPVISTDCPSGPAEILEMGKWGRLIPVGDINAMANAIMKTLNDSEHPNVESRAAEFSIDRAVDGYLKFLVPDAALNLKTSGAKSRTKM